MPVLILRVIFYLKLLCPLDSFGKETVLSISPSENCATCILFIVVRAPPLLVRLLLRSFICLLLFGIFFLPQFFCLAECFLTLCFEQLGVLGFKVFRLLMTELMVRRSSRSFTETLIIADNRRVEQEIHFLHTDLALS